MLNTGITYINVRELPNDRGLAVIRSMNRIIVIPLENAEYLRSELNKKELLDKERKIRIIDNYNCGKCMEIPVLDDITGYRTIEQADPKYYQRYRSLRDRLKNSIPDHELCYVPSGWQIIGEIIVISIPEEISSRGYLIAKTLLEMYPRCRCVVRDHGITGQFREPMREILIGSDTETLQKEHECLFKLDVTKIMYSKGNLSERRRMSKYGKDEIVVDMFAGIGYFSIPMAVHSTPRKIISIELNPLSHQYLCENIELNHVGEVIEPVNGDCACVTPKGIADRVIMGYVGTTHEYLAQGIDAIRKEGGMLHYHETTPEERVFVRPIERIRTAAAKLGREIEIKECHRIKKYSPGVWHVVVDVLVK